MRRGSRTVIPGAVAIYERDAGISWKHGDNVRRARELVVSLPDASPAITNTASTGSSTRTGRWKCARR